VTVAIPSDWYDVAAVADGLSLIRERHVASWLRCNIWHVRGRDRDILIDSGMGLRPLKTEIPRLAERPLTAISTHCHFDHIGGAHEFADRRGHASEAHIHANPTWDATAATGWIMAETFLAAPRAGFEPAQFRIAPAPLTGYLDEGDVVDLGDRVFNVFHLPGHSPGSIALYERKSGTLFSGDVVYDGPLFDTVYHSDKAVYRHSLSRLRALPVSAVYAGHDAPFGRDRMVEIIDAYLDGSGETIGDLSNWIAAKR
jgi:glyoxylase-like metal-dependent hydrolase (beta-lactamase superfamily II)